MKTNDKLRSGMPKRGLILRHWKDWLIENKDLLEEELVKPKCFACGDLRALERAHLRPVSSFKVDNKLRNDVSNLVLLCRSCHIKTENKSIENTLTYILMKEFRDPLEITMEDIQMCCGFEDDDKFDQAVLSLGAEIGNKFVDKDFFKDYPFKDYTDEEYVVILKRFGINNQTAKRIVRLLHQDSWLQEEHVELVQDAYIKAFQIKAADDYTKRLLNEIRGPKRIEVDLMMKDEAFPGNVKGSFLRQH